MDLEVSWTSTEAATQYRESFAIVRRTEADPAMLDKWFSAAHCIRGSDR